MNKATKGVEWIDLPIVEEVPEPVVEVKEIQQDMQHVNLNEYEQPNQPGNNLQRAISCFDICEVD